MEFSIKHLCLRVLNQWLLPQWQSQRLKLLYLDSLCQSLRRKRSTTRETIKTLQAIITISTNSSRRNKLDYEKAYESPEKTTANFLGKGNEETDIMDGNRKRKVPYREVQAKDAINYK